MFFSWICITYIWLWFSELSWTKATKKRAITFPICISFIFQIDRISFINQFEPMDHCDGSNSFSKNYMILRPDETDVFDLVGVLFSSDLEKRKGVHCQEWRGESFQRRRIIFVSISVQKFLRSVAKPMACFGSVVEMWLNLLSCNHNFSMLLLNFLQG